jgi:hypothetical protein
MLFQLCEGCNEQQNEEENSQMRFVVLPHSEVAEGHPKTENK